MLLEQLDSSRLDLVLVEGFKHVAFPKIELHRTELEQPLLFPDDADIIAVATDGPLATDTMLPVLDLNNPAEIAEFVIKFMQQSAA